jgi:hypothetical protein
MSDRTSADSRTSPGLSASPTHESESAAELGLDANPPDPQPPRAEVEPEAGAHKGKKKKKKDKKDDGKLGSSRGIETMFRTSYRTHLDLSSIADNKANIMISINGIIISIVIASISPKIDANPWLLVPTGVLLVGCAISLVYAVLAARPRVTSKPLTLDDVLANKANILFFGNFVRLSEPDYLEGMTALVENTDRLYTNMMRDIYGLGSVLMRKYALLRTAYTIFMFGLVISVALFILVFVWITPGTGLTVG